MTSNKKITEDNLREKLHKIKKSRLSGLEPIHNPNSECYGCEAGMCDHLICRGDQYHYFIGLQNDQ